MTMLMLDVALFFFSLHATNLFLIKSEDGLLLRRRHANEISLAKRFCSQAIPVGYTCIIYAFFSAQWNKQRTNTIWLMNFSCRNCIFIANILRHNSNGFLDEIDRRNDVNVLRWGRIIAKLPFLQRRVDVIIKWNFNVDHKRKLNMNP